MVGYMITNGSGFFIRHDQASNKYVPINGQSHGTIWSDRKKTDNIRNGLSKNLKPNYYVIQVVTDDPQAAKVTPKTTIQPPIQSTPAPEEEMITMEELAEIDVSTIRGFEKWQTRVEGVLQFMQDADARMNELHDELSKADREVSDLLHYMEFNQLNASEGYKIYRKTHEILLRRREIKNESKVMTAIQRSAPPASGLANVLKAIQNMDTQKYTPRVLGELFE